MFNSKNLLLLHKRQVHSDPSHDAGKKPEEDGIDEEFDTEVENNLQGLFNDQNDDKLQTENDQEDVVSEEERANFINGQIETSDLYTTTSKLDTHNNHFNTDNKKINFYLTPLGRRLVESGLFLEVMSEILADMLDKAGAHSSNFLQITSKSKLSILIILKILSKLLQSHRIHWVHQSTPASRDRRTSIFENSWPKSIASHRAKELC